MSTILMRTGAVLLIGGVAVVGGYLVYYGSRAFFTEPSIPLAIKVAIPAISIGFVLVFLAVVWERYRKSKQEHLGEFTE